MNDHITTVGNTNYKTCQYLLSFTYFQNCQNVPRRVCANSASGALEEECIEEVVGQECRNETYEQPETVCNEVPQEICKDVPRQVCNPIKRQQCEIVPYEDEVENCRIESR